MTKTSDKPDDLFEETETVLRGTVVLKGNTVAERFYRKLSRDQKEMPKEFQETVDKYFWDLI